MKNLASHDESAENVERTSAVVHKELTKAGITPVLNAPQNRGEVPSKYDGVYEGFTFDRAWYYWRVHGHVPLHVAEELYNDPNGRQDVRVNGDCSCPEPSTQAFSVDRATGKIIIDEKEWQDGLRIFGNWGLDQLADWKTKYIPKSEAGEADRFISHYHIDTQEGLNFFMQTIKKHGVTGKKHEN